MFFANDINGIKTYIDDATIGQLFFCPVCNGKMIQKRGDINAHHFAHISNNECDPWYTEKKSKWHRRMQDHFDRSTQEVVIRNDLHTEYHIADVVLQSNAVKYVVEFQHSAISQRDFIERSFFYLKCGYNVIWIFDFCECKNKPKKIFIESIEYDKENGNEYTRLVWPGNDRIRFLDELNLNGLENRLFIFFHIYTGIGKLVSYSPDGYRLWERWEYIDPFHKKERFALLHLESFNKTNDFFATCFSEDRIGRTHSRDSRFVFCQGATTGHLIHPATKGQNAGRGATGLRRYVSSRRGQLWKNDHR